MGLSASFQQKLRERLANQMAGDVADSAAPGSMGFTAQVDPLLAQKGMAAPTPFKPGRAVAPPRVIGLTSQGSKGHGGTGKLPSDGASDVRQKVSAALVGDASGPDSVDAAAPLSGQAGGDDFDQTVQLAAESMSDVRAQLSSLQEKNHPSNEEDSPFEGTVMLPDEHAARTDIKNAGAPFAIKKQGSKAPEVAGPDAAHEPQTE